MSSTFLCFKPTGVIKAVSITKPLHQRHQAHPTASPGLHQRHQALHQRHQALHQRHQDPPIASQGPPIASPGLHQRHQALHERHQALHQRHQASTSVNRPSTSVTKPPPASPGSHQRHSEQRIGIYEHKLVLMHKVNQGEEFLIDPTDSF
ncbi:uncharacterized protein LOC121874144 [Homarus americanus]|uniref:uncharacterized protein LOC121874144 n=1 Tax=Homarus americanus TaxID=6706 RepID=UPI001C44DCE5|nr:uncharacterized protein LOC121874144 [Homarus americanus]